MNQTQDWNLYIPAPWREMLAKLQTQWPEAIIAGGALRDLDYHKEVKDLDIWIPCDSTEIIHEHMVRLGLSEQSDEGIEAAYEITERETDRLIFALYNIERDGVDFDIIFCTRQGADISTFDFSICQIAFDGKRRYTTPEYTTTLANRIITQENVRPVKRLQERIERIHAKFPDMPIFLKDGSIIDAR